LEDDVSTGADIDVRGNGAGGVTADDRRMFADVARAHYLWDLEETSAGATRAEGRDAFMAALAQFEREVDGRVVDAYWSQKQASGVALVEMEPAPPNGFRRLLRWLRLWYPVPEYRVYRETDWVTVEFPELANLLHECDVLAIKARWGLEGIHEAVVIPWLMAVEAHILGFIERSWRRREMTRAEPGRESLPDPADGGPAAVAAAAVREAVEAERERVVGEEAAIFYRHVVGELNRIEDYYHEAGEKQGRLHYLAGMVVFGVLVVGGAAVIAAGALALFGLLDLDEAGIRRFYACMAAGAVGAIVSVLIRMSGHGSGFTIDHELGAAGVRRLGAFRPLIGAVSGVVVSFLVQTTLVPIDKSELTIEFYVVVAFLAGFSERWTRVVLDGAMRTIEKADGDSDATHGTTRPPRRRRPHGHD